jgi:pimeloyl-ACP methyl ester carboxylesterase
MVLRDGALTRSGADARRTEQIMTMPRVTVIAVLLSPGWRLGPGRSMLPQVQTPVQIIAGSRDSAVPPVNAEFLHEWLPHSKLDILDAGHFIWEDGADQYASLVTTWWSGGYSNALPAGRAQSNHSPAASIRIGNPPCRLNQHPCTEAFTT